MRFFIVNCSSSILYYSSYNVPTFGQQGYCVRVTLDFLLRDSHRTLSLIPEFSSITGSSSGIGRATAIECARNGAKLVLHHIGDTQSQQDITTLRDEIHRLNKDLGFGGEPRTADVAADIRDPRAGQL